MEDIAVPSLKSHWLRGYILWYRFCDEVIDHVTNSTLKKASWLKLGNRNFFFPPEYALYVCCCFKCWLCDMLEPKGGIAVGSWKARIWSETHGAWRKNKGVGVTWRSGSINAAGCVSDWECKLVNLCVWVCVSCRMMKLLFMWQAKPWRRHRGCKSKPETFRESVLFVYVILNADHVTCLTLINATRLKIESQEVSRNARHMYVILCKRNQ